MGAITTAACLAVGSELLGDQRLDTNSLTITRTLARYGVAVREKRVLGDAVGDIAAAVRELIEVVDLVVVTGGLGPTADDITRDAVSSAVGRDLVYDPELEDWVRQRYADLKRTMPAICKVMAYKIPGSCPLRNTRGTAPGFMFRPGRALLAVFPGVPWEMELMLDRDLVPELQRCNPGVRRLTRTLLLGGVIESETESRISRLYQRFGGQEVTILASFGLIRLVLAATGESLEAEAQLDEMETAFREVLGDDVAGVDEDGLQQVVVQQLRARGATVATAESCTGGLVSARLTEVPGASDVLLGALVAYSNQVKESQLGVPSDLLVSHGAVSAETARAMAEGVCQCLGSDWGVAITGIAGPTGGSVEKPVGLVHWAVAGPTGVWSEHAIFPGDRPIVREWSTNAALDLLRRRLLAAEEP